MCVPAKWPTLRGPKITAFTVKNYRSFLEETRVELRPLTLLFGYNNSGKSSGFPAGCVRAC